MTAKVELRFHTSIARIDYTRTYVPRIIEQVKGNGTFSSSFFGRMEMALNYQKRTVKTGMAKSAA